jgi:flagellar P-ring protein precursor FlgI
MEVIMRRAIILYSLLYAANAHAVRLKQLVDVEGVRPNALVGIGLVVGLGGTGDDTTSIITRRELANLARRLGMVLDPNDTNVKARNVAAVMVTAELPAFARPGMKIDVSVSSMGTAKSLQGGTLLLAPLKGADLSTYALAQGSLLVGGYAAEGASGSAAKKNQTTVGRIPGGATIERPAPGGLAEDKIVLILREADFTNAARIAKAVDGAIGDGAARVRDPGAVEVTVGEKWKGRVVELVATLEAVETDPDVPGRVVLDEKTGTVVVGGGVAISPVAIAYGGISIEVGETPAVSQPGPQSKGNTVVTQQSQVKVHEKDGELRVIPAAATVGDVASALNALGVKPRDLVAVFQALKASGALRAEVEVL